MLSESLEIFAQYQEGALHQMLIEAIDQDNVQVTQDLLEQGAKPTIGSNWWDKVSVLPRAVTRGNIRMITLLLEYGAKPNSVTDQPGPDDVPLTIAINHNRIDIVQSLLEHGAQNQDFAYADAVPLAAAITSRNEQMVKMLLEYGADANLEFAGYTIANSSYLIPAWYKAVTVNSAPILSLLLRYNAHIDTTNLTDMQFLGTKPGLYQLIRAFPCRINSVQTLALAQVRQKNPMISDLLKIILGYYA